MNKLNYTLWVGSRTIASKEKLCPNPNLSPIPKPNPNPNRGGGQFSSAAIVRIPTL